jgi:outer membrane protein OmpA-like peptidoglycan-associated protein
MLCLAMTLGLTGCTYVQRGVAIGAGAGALVGGVIGAQGGEGALEGALWGAGGGGIIGALIGDGMTPDLSGENANLKSQIAALTEENENLKKAANKPQVMAPAPPPVDKVEFVIEGDVLFASGSNVLTPKGIEILAALAAKIRNDYPGKSLNIEGDTDNVPISASRWKSNWELGSGRALSVLHYMIDKQGFSATAMSATTFGEFKPVATRTAGRSSSCRSSSVGRFALSRGRGKFRLRADFLRPRDVFSPPSGGSLRRREERPLPVWLPLARGVKGRIVAMDLERFYRASTRPAILLACLLCLGCAAPQVTPSGFLSDYASLRLREDSTLYYSDSPTSVSAKTHVILLRDAQLRTDQDTDADLGREMCQVFTTRLRLRILQRVKGNIFVLDKESELAPYRDMPGVGIMVVDCAITRIGGGVGLARYLVGFGLGDARVTVEAKATLAARGARETHQMVVFARSHGNPHGGLNPRSLSARYCLRLACDSAAEKTAKHLAERMAPPEAKWWERKP